MQFRLSTLLLLFVVLWSSLALFGGGGGIAVFIIVVLVAASIVRPSWLLALLGFLLLLALLLPAVSTVREAGRRAQCMNNLKNIALALHAYRDAHGSFPPAYIADKNGKPMHSWRVLILPYLEREDLYKQYNFNEPWDSPNNRKVLASRPPMYTCPSDSATWDAGNTCTSYLAVVGANAAWSGGTPTNLTGDLSTTVMLVEAADAGVPWTEPKDISLDALLTSSPESPTVSGKHFPNDEFFTYSLNSGASVASADGHVRFLPAGLLASDKFPDLLKVAGFREEYLDAHWSDVGRRIHWTNCTALAVWLASTGWLLVRAVRSRKAAQGAAEQTQQTDRQ